MVKILQREDPILRVTAEPVTESEFNTEALQKIITDMQHAMHGEDDAVAIAAPQIGISKRLFLVSGKVFTQFSAENHPDLVCINPQIIKSSKDSKQMSEGCLSVRYLYGKVRRSSRVTIRAYDIHGKVFERGASGLLAQIFQHEIDHLNGILFTDTAKDLKDMPPEKK